MEPVMFGNYLIYPNGTIFSFFRKKFINGRIGNHGYRYITIDKKNWLIHTIVALCFLKEFPNEQINHKDGNKLNNSHDNLEWVTRSENQKHAYINKLLKIPTNRSKDLSDEIILTIRTLQKPWDYDFKKITKNRVYSIAKRNFKDLPSITIEETTKERNKYGFDFIKR